MILQPCSSLHHRNISRSSTLSHSFIRHCKTQFPIQPKPLVYRKVSVICKISQVHSYGTTDFERRPMDKWNSIYKKISLMENPELGAGSVLNDWEKNGKKLTKWELCRVVKELRKYKRHKQALEVYDWMNNRGERFRMSASDAAIQLDLVAKVREVSSAEDFFAGLPDNLKDKRVYGALLNAYVRSRMREKAESLLETMREKEYTNHPLPFNVMMTLYMNIKEYDKVESLVSEMKRKQIPLDIYSYNIWLSSCGFEGLIGNMEEVYEKMKMDRVINANWTTYSTMATMYIKSGLNEKAEDCLRRVEARITGRDRIPYHYLLSLYGGVGNKTELYRVWKVYNAVFPTIPNLGYHAMISSLLRLNDIDGAENVYEAWLPVRSSYDPRIGNQFMSWYMKNVNLERVERFFSHMIELGGKPNSTTWEILAEGHIGEKKIFEALNCYKEAFACDGSKSWRPKPSVISAFIKLCEEEDNLASKDAVVGLLRDLGCLKDETYASIVEDRDHTNYDNAARNEEDSSEFLNELQGTL